MAEIIERVGFDTAQAVSALNNLDAALRGVNRRLTNFNKQASQTAGVNASKAFDNVAKSAQRAKKSVTDTGKALTQTGKEGAAAAQKITIGFSGLAKALVAREAVQALNRIKQAILDSADAAAEFEIAIARISNIAQGPGSGIAQLTQSLGELSVELGRPSTEVTEAAFEALQNDLGTTRETIELLQGAAQDLALVTGGTLTQSINSLSSVLKSYDLSIEEANRVTDIFFAAIDKGRITLDELENSLGKITPLAARLDIDFENVAAAMAAITQQGTSAAVANTQLRSIFQKLIRPTEELQGAFQKLGVTSFNELIARSGNLQVALEEIAGAFNNNDQAIAKAFGRLRGQLGVFNLLANEGKIFKSTLDAVSDSAGSAAAAADRIRDTDAFRGQQAAEEFNKTLREIGESVLQARTAFTEFANDVLPSGQSIAQVLGFIATGAIALGGGAVLGSINAFGGALLVALAPLLPFIGAAAVGFAAGTAIDAFFTSTAERLEEIAERSEKASERIAESSEEALQRSNQEIDQLLNQRGETVDRYVAGLTSAFEKETQVLRDAAKRADAILQESFTDFEAGLDDIFKRIENQVKNVQNALKGARGRAADATQALEDFRFDKAGRNLTATQNFNRNLERAETTAKNLSEALKDARTDPQAADEAGRLADRLEEQAQAIRDRAEQEENAFRRREGIAKADELEEQALEAREALAKGEVASLEQKEAVTASILNKNKVIKEELELQLKLLKEQLDILNAQGKIKTPAERAQDLDAAEDTAAKARDLQSQFTEGFFETFGEQGNLDKLGDSLNKGIQQAQVDFSNIAQQLQEKINEPEYKIFVEAEVNAASISEQIDAALGDARETGGINPVARQEAARARAEELLREQTTAQQSFTDATNEFANKQEATADSLKAAIDARTEADTATLQGLITQFDNLQTKLSDPSLTAEGLAQIEAQFVNLGNSIAGLIADEQLSSDVAAALEAAIKSSLEQVEAAENQITFSAQFSEEEILGLKNLIAGIKPDPVPFQTVETAVKNTAESADQAATGVNSMKTAAQAAIAPFNALAAAAERAARAALAAAQAKAQAGLYHGGKADYLASGGRGSDSISAMLSPGEFVMNARSTRQFFSQIQAMNAGQSPQFRETGGSVTNVGDINVNVTGGAGSENPDAVGRQIANSLRRELRRNTSAL